MNSEVPNLTRNKMVFPDWTWVTPGYGYPLIGKNQPPLPPTRVPRGLAIRLFPPLLDTAPLIATDKPWEERLGPYCTVIRIGDRWRLYYETFPITPNGLVSDVDSRLAIAESTDGIHWEKPALGILPCEGFQQTNLIFGPSMAPDKSGLHGASIFEDPTAPPELRYKMTHRRRKNTVYGASSPDGIRWQLHADPIIDAKADSQDIVQWDPDLQRYIGFFRHNVGDRRVIARGETTDFYHWPDPVLLLRSHPEFGPDADFYTNGYHRWPGTFGASTVHLLFPSVYHRTADYVDSECWFSHNTWQWDRPLGNPIIVPTTRAQARQGMTYIGHGFWTASDLPFEWAAACITFGKNHNTPHLPGDPRDELHRVHWREDGFAGIVAEEPGEFWTPPFYARMNDLVINAVTMDGGTIQLELCDHLCNRVIEGTEIEKCLPLTGDLRWTPVRWVEPVPLLDYDDALLRLHVRLTRATLFGIKFVEEPTN